MKLLRSIVALFGLGLTCASAANPPWWYDAGYEVVDKDGDRENLGVANVGQAKWIAQNALRALRQVTPEVANLVEQDLTGPGHAISHFGAPQTDAEREANFAPLLTGQLKAIVAPFYQRLHEAAPNWLNNERDLNGFPNDGGIFPWPANSTNESSNTPVVIGQLKAAFALNFSVDREANDLHDDLPDLWEEAALKADPNSTYQSIAEVNSTNYQTLATSAGVALPPRAVYAEDLGIYNIEVEQVFESRYLSQNPVGYPPFEEDDGITRYSKKQDITTWSIHDSIYWADGAGSSSTTYEYLLNGNVVYADDWVDPVEAGTYMWDFQGDPANYIWTEDYIWENGEVPGPVNEYETFTSPTLSSFKTTSTHDYEAMIINPAGPYDIINRTGKEVIIYNVDTVLSKPFTYPLLWDGYMGGRPWTEGTPQTFGPGLNDHIYRQFFGDVGAVSWVETEFKTLIFQPLYISDLAKASNVDDYGTEKQLKSLRWRWVKFDPNKPFENQYVAPPAGYRKDSHFVVTQIDELEPTLTDPGNEQRQVLSSFNYSFEGGKEGWQTMDLSSFKKHEPALLPATTFERGSRTKVLFEDFAFDLVSRDKFLGGEFEVGPATGYDLKLEFVNTDSGQNLGTFGPFVGTSYQFSYDSVPSMLALIGNSPASAGGDRVFFVRDAENPYKFRFYTCFNQTGHIEIRLSNSSGNFLTVPYLLKPNADFANVISYIDGWIKGDGFNFPDPQAPIGLAARRMALNSLSVSDELDPLVAVCLAPFTDVIGQVEGLTTTVIALFDGIKAGFHDDYEFLLSIKNGVGAAADWLTTKAMTELVDWTTNREKRIQELIATLSSAATNGVLIPLVNLQNDLSTWEGCRRRAWSALKTAYELDRQIETIKQDFAKAIFQGICDWGDDFLTRMQHESEKTRWLSKPWAIQKLLPEDYGSNLAGYYTFGYSFGYLLEQASIGVATGEVFKIGQLFLKEGGPVLARLCTRAAGSIAARAEWIKVALADSELLSDLTRLFFDDGLRVSVAGPFPELPPGAPATADILEQMMKGPGYDLSKYGRGQLIEDIEKSRNFRKLAKIPGMQGKPLAWAGVLAQLLNGDLDDAVLKNFMKIVEEKLLFQGKGKVFNEWVEDFLRVSKGSMSQFVNRPFVTELSEADRLWLKTFLSEPDPGYIWKFQEGAATDWKANIRRGILIEIDRWHSFYEADGWTHNPILEGLDFTKGKKATQVKSLGVLNENTVSRMREAMRDLVSAGESSGFDDLILDLQIKPGLDAESLMTDLNGYIKEMDELGIKAPETKLKVRYDFYDFVPPGGFPVAN
jgi:hypothetical protein